MGACSGALPYFSTTFSTTFPLTAAAGLAAAELSVVPAILVVAATAFCAASVLVARTSNRSPPPVTVVVSDLSSGSSESPGLKKLGNICKSESENDLEFFETSSLNA